MKTHTKIKSVKEEKEKCMVTGCRRVARFSIVQGKKKRLLLCRKHLQELEQIFETSDTELDVGTKVKIDVEYYYTKRTYIGIFDGETDLFIRLKNCIVRKTPFPEEEAWSKKTGLSSGEWKRGSKFLVPKSMISSIEIEEVGKKKKGG